MPASAPALRLHAHADEHAFVQGVVSALLEAIASERRQLRAPLILLSGGSTPVPVYRALAQQVTDWSGITLGLVDERFLAPDAAGSNARLIRETLHDGVAAPAAFWPLADLVLGLQGSVDAANARLLARAQAPSVVLLGMGDDGHTASLFPGSPDLLPALASEHPYAGVNASGCPGAGSWPQRISLTPIGWKAAQRRLLLIRGDAKRRLLETALRERNVETLPVAAALALGDAPLEVHWCP